MSRQDIHSQSPHSSLEAKIVVLGSQGVGKTSLVHRFIAPHKPLHEQPSTVGANFHSKRLIDPDSNTTVRLQIWDTAGQERFRSISRLYYRGANAGVLCYDITDEKSWEDMTGWLRELRQNCAVDEKDEGDGLIIHVVGTKSDIVAADPNRRKVPFERTIAYVAEQLHPSQSSSPNATLMMKNLGSHSETGLMSPDSKRSSGFWGQESGWDSCHEVNSLDGEGIEEVFRVISRKLVDQRNRRLDKEAARVASTTPFSTGERGDYFSSCHGSHPGSFRLGVGDKRSWLGLPSVGLVITDDDGNAYEPNVEEARRKGRCC